MVPSLRSLSIKASLQDLANLKHYVNIVPCTILYDLVQYCFSAKPKKTLAFQTLFRNWPFDTFSIQSIGITLNADDIFLMLYAVQKCQFGMVKHLDLVQKEFSNIESRTTKQYIKLLHQDSPLLNTDCHGCEKQMSPSSENAVKEVKVERNDASLSYHNRPKYTVAKRTSNMILTWRDADIIEERKRKSSEYCCHEVIVIDDDDEDSDDAAKLKKEITIYADLYVGVDDMEIINILANEVYVKNNLLIKIVPVRIKMGYLPSNKIVCVLNSMIDTGNLCSLDLSYNNLKISEDSFGLSSITNQVEKFKNLENVCLAYNRLSDTGCQLFISCLKQLPKLKRLELSGNRFGKSLCEFFSSDLRSKCLTELILADCHIKESVLVAMAECKWISNLEKLVLANNKLTGRRKVALKTFLIKYKATLTYVDVFNCGLSDEDISDIRSAINDSILLNVAICFSYS